VDSGPAPISQAPRDFRTTHWSLVLEAGAGAGTESGRSALETLCRHYWYPLYAFIRRRGHEPPEAEDLTQEFFAQLLAGPTLASARPERGRFRTYLLAALKGFLANQWDHANRLKRGGGREIIALDALEPEARYRVEPTLAGAEDVLFDRQWAQALTNGVIARLRAEAEHEGNLSRFEALKVFLALEPAGDSYTSMAGQLGLSVTAVKSAIHRLRRRYGQMLREEIGHTLDTPDDIEDEIRHLFAALSA
jgi:RNA polymerase sigma factor (sigma-70 family)